MPKARSFSPTQRATTGSVLHVLDRFVAPDKAGNYPPLLNAAGVAVTITLMGIDSPRARRLRYAQSAEMQNTAWARLELQRDGKNQEPVSAEDKAKDHLREVDRVAALTIDWTGITEDDDSASPCTTENARALYLDEDDILAQAIEFLNDRPRFFGASSTLSDGTAVTVSN